MTDPVVTLDVREDIREGREPFSRIMKAAASLADAQLLRLIAPFEPVPLYRMLAQQGFSHRAEITESGDWEVLFSRGALPSSQLVPGLDTLTTGHSVCGLPESCGCELMKFVELDARGLEPPQPLVTILEALITLPPGTELQARTDRRPMHLYAQLEERGFIGQSEAQPDGSFITRIRRL